jgi:hypothetical protein
MTSPIIKVVNACPCYLAQNLNALSETLEKLNARINDGDAAAELHKVVRPLEKALEQCKKDYKEHVTKWREQYALIMMEQLKRSALEPLQTSSWKQGDLKKLLEDKPKKTHKRAMHTSGAIAQSSLKKEKREEESLED